MTRTFGQAGGNFALSLLMSVAANVLGTFTTPIVLSFAVTLESVSLPVLDMVIKLTLSILVPLIVGKALQESSFHNYAVRRAANRHAKFLSLLSNGLLVAIPWMKFSATAYRGTLSRVGLLDIGLACVWFLLVHALFLVRPPAPSQPAALQPPVLRPLAVRLCALVMMLPPCETPTQP